MYFHDLIKFLIDKSFRHKSQKLFYLARMKILVMIIINYSEKKILHLFEDITCLYRILLVNRNFKDKIKVLSKLHLKKNCRHYIYF